MMWNVVSFIVSVEICCWLFVESLFFFFSLAVDQSISHAKPFYSGGNIFGYFSHLIASSLYF